MSRGRKCLFTLSVALVLLVCLPLAAIAAPCAQSGDETHVVASGETLWGIATRFGVTLAALQSANGIADVDQISVGQTLVIPGVGTSTGPGAAPAAAAAAVEKAVAPTDFTGIHVVARGETLFRIAERYGATAEALIAANGIADPDSLLVGQKLLVPGGARPAGAAAKEASAGGQAGFDVESLPSAFTSIEIRPDRPLQGDTVLVRVATAQDATLSGRYEGQDVLFWNRGIEHWALLPIHPMADAGYHDLAITAAVGDGQTAEVVGQIWVRPGHFLTENIDLPPDRTKLLDPKLVRKERDLLNKALVDTDSSPLWSGLWRFPLSSVTVSSEFGTRRSYNGGPATSYHEGYDFDAGKGIPVFAPADGRVVLAEQLTVRGNAVLLDHGLGVHSGYWHLSVIRVKPGDQVKAGQKIAEVGGTGLATGPHLHWEIAIGKTNVSPKQWTEQTFP